MAIDIDILKSRLTITSSNQDDMLEALITGVCSFVDSYCHRKFLTANYTDIFSGKGNNELMLHNAPITAVSLVQINDKIIPVSNDFKSPGYIFDEKKIYLRIYDFHYGVKNIIIQYVAGYADYPADVTEAIYEILSYRYQELSRIGQKSKGLKGDSVVFDINDVPPMAKSILATYRRRAMVS